MEKKRANCHISFHLFGQLDGVDASSMFFHQKGQNSALKLLIIEHLVAAV
jgi:hypothetical protein